MVASPVLVSFCLSGLLRGLLAFLEETSADLATTETSADLATKDGDRYFAQGVVFYMLWRHTGLSRAVVAYLGHCRFEVGSALLLSVIPAARLLSLVPTSSS